MRTTLAAALCCAMVLTVAGCEDSEMQAERIRAVLMLDREVTLLSLDGLPTASGVEKLRALDLNQCPAPFRSAFREYVHVSEQIVTHSSTAPAGQDRFLMTAAQRLDQARLEVSRIALAYGVAVE